MDHVWLLNFSADGELSRVPDKAPIETHRAALTHALEPLLAEGTVLGRDRGAHPRASAAAGHAWMMTDAAASELRAYGATPMFAPGDPILRAVNSRAFSQRLGVDVPGSALAASLEDLAAVIDAERTWVLRREHGFAARGRMFLESGLTESAKAWAQRSFAAGEQIECAVWLERTHDFALHGYVAHGEVWIGEPTVQVCDARGQWKETRRTEVKDLTEQEVSALRSSAEQAAEALQHAGYHGPFGIDAFRHTQGFCSRCEINARYSMGWAIGMGTLRPDLALK